MKDPTNFPETTRRWEISGHFDADVCVEIIDVTDRTPGPATPTPSSANLNRSIRIGTRSKSTLR